MTVSIFSLKVLELLRDLVEFRINNQKQFRDDHEISELLRLNLKLTKLINGFKNKEYDF